MIERIVDTLDECVDNLREIRKNNEIFFGKITNKTNECCDDFGEQINLKEDDGGELVE